LLKQPLFATFDAVHSWFQTKPDIFKILPDVFQDIAFEIVQRGKKRQKRIYMYKGLKLSIVTASVILIGGTQVLCASQDASISLGKISVEAKKTGALGSEDVLTSVDIIDGEYLENQNVDNTMELLNMVPGVYHTDYNQGVISGDIAIRGFNAEGGTPHVKLLIDGIPSNLNNGFNDLKSIFPLEIEKIALVKGTNDPRYGLHNLAGNLNVTTKRGGNYNQAKLLFGSFGTMEAQVITSMEKGDFAQTYFLGYRKSDGYRDHSDAEKFSLSGKWFFSPEDKPYILGFIARVADFDADSPGYLSQEQAEKTPDASPSFSAADGGEQRNNHISFHLDYDLSNNLSWSFKSYIQSYERTRRVRFSEKGGQRERLQDEQQYGAISVLTLRPDIDLMDDLTLEWGVDYQQQDVINTRHNIKDGVLGTARRNNDFDLSYLGSYIQTDMKPVENLRITTGLRVDTFDGNLEDKLKGVSKDINDYGAIWQPKISAVYTVAENYNFYANWGRTFQIASGAGAFIADGKANVDPSVNDGWEVGAKANLSSNIFARVGLWEQTATDEVRLKFDESGDTENVGETKRNGFDIEVVAQISDKLDIWASYVRQESELVNPVGKNQEQVALRKGNEVDHVPEFTAKIGTNYQFTNNFKMSASVYTQGDYYINKENVDGKFGDYTLVNLDAYYKWNDITIGAHVKNITDENYAYVWSFGPGKSTLHGPGDGISGYITASMDF